MSALTAYGVARAMLILGGWNSSSRIGRQMGVQREAVSYWLNRMLEERQVERQARTTSGGGFEWALTDAGQQYAICRRPDEEEIRPGEERYNHRGLAAAMGMLHQITPPTPSRMHFLNGKGRL